jgi:hypothetical protein
MRLNRPVSEGLFIDDSILVADKDYSAGRFA